MQGLFRLSLSLMQLLVSICFGLAQNSLTILLCLLLNQISFLMRAIFNLFSTFLSDNNRLIQGFLHIREVLNLFLGICQFFFQALVVLDQATIIFNDLGKEVIDLVLIIAAHFAAKFFIVNV